MEFYAKLRGISLTLSARHLVWKGMHLTHHNKRKFDLLYGDMEDEILIRHKVYMIMMFLFRVCSFHYDHVLEYLKLTATLERKKEGADSNGGLYAIASIQPFSAPKSSAVPSHENNGIKQLDLCYSSPPESKLNNHYPCQLKDEQRKPDPATPPCEDRSNVDQRGVHYELV
jgi:hypothetical protein